MRITADTNLLLRAVVRDDVRQAEAADAVIRSATLIALPLPTLCEFAWVLRTAYRFSCEVTALTIRRLIRATVAEYDVSAVEAGLRMLDAGGDFADGVIAHQGAWLGGKVFVSFDRKAVRLLSESGYETKLLPGEQPRI